MEKEELELIKKGYELTGRAKQVSKQLQDILDEIK